jgi:hypothetical protein
MSDNILSRSGTPTLSGNEKKTNWALIGLVSGGAVAAGLILVFIFLKRYSSKNAEKRKAQKRLDYRQQMLNKVPPHMLRAYEYMQQQEIHNKLQGTNPSNQDSSPIQAETTQHSPPIGQITNAINKLYVRPDSHEPSGSRPIPLEQKTLNRGETIIRTNILPKNNNPILKTKRPGGTTFMHGPAKPIGRIPIPPADDMRHLNNAINMLEKTINVLVKTQAFPEVNTPRSSVQIEEIQETQESSVEKSVDESPIDESPVDEYQTYVASSIEASPQESLMEESPQSTDDAYSEPQDSNVEQTPQSNIDEESEQEDTLCDSVEFINNTIELEQLNPEVNETCELAEEDVCELSPQNLDNDSQESESNDIEMNEL